MSNETHHFFRIRSFLAAFCLVFALLSAAHPAAAARPGPAIDRVDRSMLKEEPERYAPEMMAQRHLMFERDDQVAGERFAVRWVPTPGGSPAGSEIVFTYRQSRDNRPRTLRIRYPFKVTATRTASFKIQGKAYRDRGSVTAWHVQLMQGERILATRSSAHWSTQP